MTMFRACLMVECRQRIGSQKQNWHTQGDKGQKWYVPAESSSQIKAKRHARDGCQCKGRHQRSGSSSTSFFRKDIANDGHCDAAQNASKCSGGNTSRNQQLISGSKGT